MSAFRDSSRRQDTYKAKGAFKQDELRRRREEAQVEILEALPKNPSGKILKRELRERFS